MSTHLRNLPAAMFLSVLAALMLWPSLAAVGLVPGRLEVFEKRQPAPFPSPVASLVTWEKWPRSFETFFDDNLPNRGFLLRLNAWMKYNLFATSPTPAVLVGREGWLFHAMPDDLREAAGRLERTPAEIRQLRIVLEERHDALAEHGIDYLVLVAPTKQTVYPDKLPTWLVPGCPNRGRRERLLAELERADSPVAIEDFTAALVEARHRHGDDVYYRHDSHWTYRGACEAYAWLANRHPEWFRPPAADWVEPSVERPSNLMHLMGLPGEETSVFPQPRTGFHVRPRPLDTRWLQSLAERCHVDVSTGPTGDGVLYFLADSFAGWNKPYLAENFSRTVLVNPWDARLQRYAQFPLDHIRAEKSRLVIQQLIENRLDVGAGAMSLLADPTGNTHPPMVRAARLRRLFAAGDSVAAPFRQQGPFTVISPPKPASAYIIRVEVEAAEPCLMGTISPYAPDAAPTNDPIIRNFELTRHPVLPGGFTAILCGSPAADSGQIRLRFDKPGARVIAVQLAPHPDID